MTNYLEGLDGVERIFRMELLHFTQLYNCTMVQLYLVDVYIFTNNCVIVDGGS